MAIRIKGAPPHGEKVEGPPVGWRPRPFTKKERALIWLRQHGLDYDTGEKLGMGRGDVHIDHRPPIHLRKWNPDLLDTDPPGASIDHAVALNKATHTEKTAKYDVPAIAKLRRLEADPKKSKTKWPKRPFVTGNKKPRQR